MEHSNSYIFGMLVGMLFALGLALIIGLIFRKRFGKSEYDERQKMAQGRAYKAAFYTLLIYGFVYGLFDMMTGIQWCELYTGLFIGVLLSVSVFAIICIWEDAYVSFRRKPRSVYALMLGLAAVNLLIGALHLDDPGYFVSDGLLTAQVVNPLVGVLLLVIVAAMAIRDCQLKSRENRGE